MPLMRMYRRPRDLQFDTVDQRLGIPPLHHLRDECADLGAAGSDGPQRGDPQPFVDRVVDLRVVRDPASKRDQEVLKPRGQLIGVGSGEFRRRHVRGKR